MPGSFPKALKSAQDLLQQRLPGLFPGALDATLTQAMVYALDGGKALRAFLVLEGAALHDLGADHAADAAIAIECIHAYSLIHDDLPCMDDDDLRRGKPTVHLKWDEAVAVLAGDALQSRAFELVSGIDAAPKAALRLTQTLAIAAGHRGMVGGQMLDIKAETATTPLTLDQIIAVQQGKTGALIGWAAQAGALLAQADPAPLATYGDRLGLAFQIADDILDVEGDAATLGKATQKDAEAGKATFVSLLGLDGAKRRASDLVTEACESLNPYGDKADCLREAARFVITRQS